jgi:hypothetical protein
MKKVTYKVVCVVDKGDGKGDVEHTLFINLHPEENNITEDEFEAEAERVAKVYCIESQRWSLLKIKPPVKI